MAKHNHIEKVANKAAVEDTAKTPEIEVPIGANPQKYRAEYQRVMDAGLGAQTAKAAALYASVDNAETAFAETAEKIGRAAKNEKLAGYASVAIPAVIAELEKTAKDQNISLVAEIAKAENALRKIFSARKPGSGITGPKAATTDDTFLLVVNGDSYGITNISVLRKTCGCKTSTGTQKFGGKIPESEKLAKWYPGSKNILNANWDIGIAKISADELPDDVKSAIFAKHTKV